MHVSRSRLIPILINQLVDNHEVLITVEEGSVGGFGSHVAQHIASSSALDNGALRFRSIFMPDPFMDQASPNEMNEIAGLNSSGIVETVFSALGKEIREAELKA